MQRKPLTAAELRIGNIIGYGINPDMEENTTRIIRNIHPERFNCQLVFDEDTVSEYIEHDDYDATFGIELTPDILVKIGFKEVHQFTPGVGGFKTYHLGHLTLLPNDTPNYAKEVGGYTTGFYRHPIKYVHHLQNLHYFLSGEELNYIP